MSEPTNTSETAAPPKRFALRLARAVYNHRALYFGLAICHTAGCILTGKPGLYGPMAFLYAILALRG